MQRALSFAFVASVLSSAVSCGGEIDEPLAPPPPAAPDVVGEPETIPETRDVDPAPYAPATPAEEPPPEAEPPPEPMSPMTFVGAACASDADCGYEGASCLASFPGGLCSLPCDRLCPDHDGAPLTFCAASAGSALMADGACVSRCDYSRFPLTGCREGYGCRSEERANEPGTRREVCMPGAAPARSDCQTRLAALGVRFEPGSFGGGHPEGHPELSCTVEDPVVLHPPVHGVDLRYYDGTATPNVRGACNMIEALVSTIDDLAARGVTTVLHYGTYNCRVISGTARLSRHGHGDAIDLYGFVFSDGRRYTVQEDFEEGTSMPLADAGRFLYDAVHRWHDERLWPIILTPNYNAAHRDHFHVDQTPGSNYLGVLGEGWGYLGPAPYDD